ncbi:MAG TPA: hypothetical protein VFY28_02760 [Candidatus Paceibacterota bacterium]|nr:hypothetical protein [Candidatus Paceibacterota bacterium]
MNWKGLLGLAVGVGVVLGIELMAGDIVRSGITTAENVACTVKSVEGTSDSVVMHLACDAPGYKTLVDSDLLVSHINKPQPLVCTLYQGAQPDCKPKG